MIPYDIDPSLYTGEPELPVLDDGFSPPRHEPATAQQPPPASAEAAVEPQPKSPF